MMDKLNLPKNEMAFRKVYKDLLKNEKITTVFRPKVRLCKDYRGYCDGQIVKAKVLDKIGSDWLKVRPKFIPKFLKKICITSIKVKMLGTLKDEDFKGSTPDVQDVESLRFHLGLIYNLSLEELRLDSFITKINFKYVK